MEDVSEVVGPVEEEFVEEVGHDVETHLETELEREDGEVVVDEQQDLGDAELELAVEHHFYASQQVFVVEGARDGAGVAFDRFEELVDQVEGDGDCLRVVDVCVFEQDDYENVE